MEEALENGKESPHSVHANGLIGLICGVLEQYRTPQTRAIAAASF